VRTFIATIGWTEWPVTSALLKYGLSKGDRIILLFPEKRDERSRAVVNDVRSFVSKFAPGVEVSEVPVAVHDPAVAIAELTRLISRERGELIVNLSGGMRALVIETMLALTLLRVRDLTVELRTEDKVDIQIPRIWGTFMGLSPKEEGVLKVMGERAPLSLSDLAAALKVSMAKAHRLSEHLERLGAITSKRVGKERRMELTPMGRILLAAMAGDGA
jgi:CRISPR locus-related DNA-binding protein